MSGDDAAGADLLAMEYALGTLTLAEMRQAEARAASDPAFAAEILRWQDRLSPLATLVPAVQPPPALWARLALATGARMPRPGNARGWQAATAVSLALAASLAVVAFLPRLSPPPAQFAAALAPLATPARFLAITRPDGSIALTSLGDAPAPPGRDYELWALPLGAATPVPLGVLPAGQLGGKVVVVAPGHAAPQEQLLVSEEPAGGSPTGAPTGPVVLGGTLLAVGR
jgi:anti-sigma-K factor RskA